jgi:hypothetical protein
VLSLALAKNKQVPIFPLCSPTEHLTRKANF